MNSSAAVDRSQYIKRLFSRLEFFVREHRKKVDQGEETPHMAGLLVQQYGKGLLDAADVLFNEMHIDQATLRGFQQTVQQAVSRVDPYWKEHQRERISMNADVRGTPRSLPF